MVSCQTPLNCLSTVEVARNNSPPRTLLIELPFKAITRPSIGLSLIRSVLVTKGYKCEIKYASIEFAREIGHPIYRAVSELIPHEYLFGDILFSSYVTGKAVTLDELRGRSGLAGTQLVMSEVPGWLWDSFGDLEKQAQKFVKQLAREVVESGYDIFGFNLMFQIMPSLAVAKAIKEIDPKKIIIFGGANCEGPMGFALHETYSWIDFVCRGEGELLISDLMRSICTGKPPFDQIEGLVWRDRGQTVSNGQRAQPVMDLDSLPEPWYADWIDQLDASGLRSEVDELSVPFETSRGCWYGQKNHCIFCGLSGESLAFRCKSAERVLEEFRSLLGYQIPNFYAVDLIFPQEYFKSLLPALTERRWPISLFFEVKANLTRQQLSALRDAGVNQLQPGIESLNSNLLRILRKGVLAYQNIRLLKWAAELGIAIEWNLLVSIPGERAEDYVNLADLIPLLTHLRAPTVGCSKVRIDRFSPLEFDAKKFGFENIKPAPAYEIVFGLPQDRLHNLAYFLVADTIVSDEIEQALVLLKRRVRKWHASGGAATLTSLRRDRDCILIFDHRECAERTDAELTGLEAAVYDACEEGASIDQIVNSARCDREQAHAAFSTLIANKWVVSLDNRFLSLATRLDEIIDMKRFPEAILSSVAHTVQKSRMKSMWHSIEQYRLTTPESLSGSAATNSL